jgi:hypothetical protein
MIPDQNPHRHTHGWKSAFKQLLILSINGLGGIGLLLIAYGIALYYTGEKYRFFESAAESISVVATLFGTGLTAASVWLPENKRPPEEFSKRIAAPLVVSGTVFVLFIYLKGAASIPVHVINGFAVIGLSGALFRLVSR